MTIATPIPPPSTTCATDRGFGNLIPVWEGGRLQMRYPDGTLPLHIICQETNHPHQIKKTNQLVCFTSSHNHQTKANSIRPLA